MAREYEVFRQGNDPGRGYRDYDVAVREWVQRIPTSALPWPTYEYKRRGTDVWQTVHSKRKLRRIIQGKSLTIGEAFWGRRKGGEAIIVLRAVDAMAGFMAYPDTDGTLGVRQAWATTQAAYADLGPGYEYVHMGAFVCRKIDGSSTWSQHAFHNAYDFRIRRADAPDSSIDTAATGKVVQGTHNAAEKLWQIPGHTYHAHITGDPKKFGTPACA